MHAFKIGVGNGYYVFRCCNQAESIITLTPQQLADIRVTCLSGYVIDFDTDILVTKPMYEVPRR